MYMGKHGVIWSACVCVLVCADVTSSGVEESVRIRREIRTLSKSEREAVFTALNVMKTTPQADGEAKYGPRFLNYDRMVLQHIRAASHPRCDMGHMGPAFLTFHRAIELKAETSLVAIDPTIKGLPYWDYNIDFKRTDPHNSIVWTDDFFGDSVGDPENENMIRNGFGKDWHINPNASELYKAFPVNKRSSDLTPDVVQSYNFLRGPTNLQSAPRVTRLNTTCGVLTSLTGPMVTPKNWSLCLAEPSNGTGLVQFFDCIDKGMEGVHSFYHPWLGGAWGASDGHCAEKQRPPSLADIVTGCMVCPKCAPGEDCMCHRNESACAAAREPSACTKMPMDPDGPCNACGELCKDGELGACGDGWDAASSPNDPSFLFHHANVDRLFMEWQLRWASSSSSPLPYSGFPREGMCKGHNLGDVISERDPFFGSLIDQSGDHAMSILTSADLLEATMPSQNSFYTYDSLIGERDMSIPLLEHDRDRSFAHTWV